MRCRQQRSPGLAHASRDSNGLLLHTGSEVTVAPPSPHAAIAKTEYKGREWSSLSSPFNPACLETPPHDAHRSGSTEDSSSSNWDADEKPREGLVCSDHGARARLFLAASGAQRKPGQPVVAFESGLGVSSACWAAVQRLLDRDGRIRSYRYDRAGYGHSPASDAPRTAQRLAAEQLDMLQAARVCPPYILVAHSYGAIIARELLAAAGTDAIAGMVLIDANQENTQPLLRQPFPAIQGLTDGGDYFDLIGLKRENDYTMEELGRIAMDDSVPTGKTTAEKEGALMLDSSIALAAKGH